LKWFSRAKESDGEEKGGSELILRPLQRQTYSILLLPL